MDTLQTHPMRKQSSGLHANLGQGEDGTASHAFPCTVGISPTLQQGQDPGGHGRTLHQDWDYNGKGKARSHSTISIWMDEHIHLV